MPQDPARRFPEMSIYKGMGAIHIFPSFTSHHVLPRAACTLHFKVWTAAAALRHASSSPSLYFSLLLAAPVTFADYVHRTILGHRRRRAYDCSGASNWRKRSADDSRWSSRQPVRRPSSSVCLLVHTCRCGGCRSSDDYRRCRRRSTAGRCPPHCARAEAAAVQETVVHHREYRRLMSGHRDPLHFAVPGGACHRAAYCERVGIECGPGGYHEPDE